MSFLNKTILKFLCIVHICILILLSTSNSFALSRFKAGLTTFGIWNSDENKRLDFAVWFPAKRSSKYVVIEDWLVPTPQSQAAAANNIVPGFYPIVLLSHDTASSKYSHYDIAISLAESGHIVITPEHTNDNYNDNSKSFSIDNFINRPLNLLLALETVLSSKEFSNYADESRIGLIGVGIGSITVMQLSGASTDFSTLEQMCLLHPNNILCTSFLLDEFKRLTKEEKTIKSKFGDAAFSPPLNYFAPKELIPIPEELLVKEEIKIEQPKETFKDKVSKIFSFSQNGNEINIEEQDNDFEESIFIEEPKELFISSYNQQHANPKRYSLTNGLFFTTKNLTIAELLTQDVKGIFPIELIEKSTKEKNTSTLNLIQKTPGKVVNLRPSSIRSIKAIVLLAPAGGILFSNNKAQSIAIPSAIVLAERDELYPPALHAHNYLSIFFPSPEILELSKASHSSVFSSCVNTFPESIIGFYSNSGNNKRNSQELFKFINQFLITTLGGQQEVPELSGLMSSP